MTHRHDIDTRRADRPLIAGFGGAHMPADELALRAEVAALRDEVAELRAELAALRRPKRRRVRRAGSVH